MGTVSSLGNLLTSSGNGGIDVQTLLNTAMAAAQAPLQLLQQQQSQIQSQASELTSLAADINGLATAVSALTDTTGAINSFSATSSNASVLTGSADATAAATTHSIVVNSLATTSSYYTDAVASSSTPIAAGTFQLTVGSGAPVTITVDNTVNTLDALASSINDQKLGVTASVINDSNGARLAIVSGTTGSPGDVVISNNTTGLNFHKAVTGSNASLTVDGVPISVASNTVTGIIPGVTLNLLGAAPGTPVTLTVSPDGQQAGAAIVQFVSAWNKVEQHLNTQFTVNPDGTGGGPLEADNTVRGLQQQLLSAISYSITGNGGFVNLASIGVDLNNDGTLTVNSGTLANSLSSSSSNVQNLLQGASGLASNLSTVLGLITDPTQGSITLDQKGVSQTTDSIAQRISTMQAALQTQQDNLTAQYVQMQVTLQQLPLLQAQLAQQLAALKP